MQAACLCWALGRLTPVVGRNTQRFMQLAVLRLRQGFTAQGLAMALWGIARRVHVRVAWGSREVAPVRAPDEVALWDVARRLHTSGWLGSRPEEVALRRWLCDVARRLLCTLALTV